MKTCPKCHAVHTSVSELCASCAAAKRAFEDAISGKSSGAQKHSPAIASEPQSIPESSLPFAQPSTNSPKIPSQNAEPTSNENLNDYANKASPADEAKIRENLGGMNRGPIRKIWDNVQSLWAMVRDPAAPWQSKAIAIGALVYLVSPIDVIPDVIFGIGLTDDVGVIMAAVASLAVDLKKYQADKS